MIVNFFPFLDQFIRYCITSESDNNCRLKIDSYLTTPNIICNNFSFLISTIFKWASSGIEGHVCIEL